MLARACLRKQRTKLINAQKTFARFLLDVRHDELSRRIFLDEIFIRRVFETSFDVRANLSNPGVTITALRHFVEQQLQRCQRDVTRGLVPYDRKDVFSEKVSPILP